MAEETLSRMERRKAKTRAALVGAARTFIAEGRQNAPILEITKAADVGMGSFYNHFDSREALFRATIEESLAGFGAALDALAEDLDDPAAALAQNFRLTGRLHRRNPELSKVLLSRGLSLSGPIKGLAPLAKRDFEAAVLVGRFSVRDPELALVIITGSGLALGQLLHDEPARDDAVATDEVAESLLLMLGLSAAEARDLATRPLPDLAEIDR